MKANILILLLLLILTVLYYFTDCLEPMSGGTLTQLYAQDGQDTYLKGNVGQLATGNYLLHWNHPTRLTNGFGYGYRKPNRGQLITAPIILETDDSLPIENLGKTVKPVKLENQIVEGDYLSKPSSIIDCPCMNGNCNNCLKCKNNECINCLNGLCPNCKSGNCKLCKLNHNKVNNINNCLPDSNFSNNVSNFNTCQKCTIASDNTNDLEHFSGSLNQATNTTNTNTNQTNQYLEYNNNNIEYNENNNSPIGLLSTQLASLASFGTGAGGYRLGGDWNEATVGKKPVNLPNNTVYYPDSYVGSYFTNPKPDIMMPYPVMSS